MKHFRSLFRYSCWWIIVVMTTMLVGIVMAQPADTAVDSTGSDSSVVKDSSQTEEAKADATASSEVTETSVTETGTSDESTSKDAVVEEMKTAVLRVTVTQIGGDNQPIKDARVIVTYDNAKEFELKTDEQGVALLTGLPYGKVDVDVTSSGRQSDGGTVVLDGPEKTLTFQLKPRGMDDNQE
jgi:hypothetical protein